MEKHRKLCLLGLVLFVASYIMFSLDGEFIYSQKPIDFAHWLNLIGGILLVNFNYVFPKNRLTTVASYMTLIGAIGNTGLCALDFLMWSYGDNSAGRIELANQINNTPSIFYPFQVFGPAFLLTGLSLYGWNYIRKKPLISLLIILGAPSIGISFFVLNNGMLMAISCSVFALGLGLLLSQSESKSFEEKK